jgi:hypothetical protein
MNDDKSKTYTHESYGAITVSRASGSGHLFGSDAVHHHFVHVQIRHAEMRRDLSHDWIYSGGNAVVEFYMSEAQWARFVSSFGDGTGTPITLRSIQGKSLEKTPEPTHFTSEFRDEVKKTVGKAVGTLEQLMGQLKEALLPGNKTLGKKDLAVLLQGIEQSVMQVKDNLPYVEKCFDETMENKMSEALIEFEGITSQRLRDIGIATVNASLPESSFQRGLSLTESSTPMCSICEEKPAKTSRGLCVGCAGNDVVGEI